ncbi:MAG: transcription termination/antitermination factor NusG [Planctomycetes bacterium]|nr:transcription termination/antitermination factor NusG [Planctomycetota bacterium]
MAKKWYVLRAQSGREDKVKETLEKRVKLQGLEHLMSRILVPSETVSEIKGGAKSVRERKIYPGYIMLELEVGDDGAIPDAVWFLLRETPGVGDFVGGQRKPVPMAQKEVEKLLGEVTRKEEKPKLKIEFREGDSVKIKEGPFENFDGVVEEVVPAKGLVRVVVTIFGRATPVELEYWQVEAV